MPTFTPHFNLAMFSYGDVYLSSLDRSRFTIIDNQLSFVAAICGDGVIDGWIVASNGSTITVSPGIGLIEGFSTTTYGTTYFDVADNNRYYIYSRRKQSTAADHSSFSDMATITYVDSTSPSNVSGITVATFAYNYLTLQWTSNTEKDIDYYDVYRGTNGISFTQIATTQNHTYQDTDVSSNTTYYYKIFATDLNGLTSASSSIVSHATSGDPRQPSDPGNVDVVNGHETLEIVWDAAVFLVHSYRVTAQQIDTEGAPEGSPLVYNTTTRSLILTGLTNGQTYQITVQSVSLDGVLSSGVVVRGVPSFSYGATEFEAFNISETVTDDSFNLDLHLSWTLNIDPYLDMPSYFYITVSSGNESAQASYYDGVGDVAEITGYTLVDGTEQTIHENTDYTIQIQSVNSDGLRSVPYIIRHHTSKYSPPLPVNNLVATASYTQISRSVVATWNNPIGVFSTIHITAIKKPNATVTNPATWTYIAQNKDIGPSASYSVPFSDIDNECLYTFIVNTVDSFGNISSDTITTVSLAVSFGNTFISQGVTLAGVRPPVPTQMSVASGNDQVTLYWNAANSDFIAFYHIWRAPVTSIGPGSSDFLSLGTVPSDAYKFNDYTAQNGSQYFYFVTSIDIFSQESPNPTEGFISYPYAVGEPRSHTDLVKPPVIDAAVDPDDPFSVLLSWTPDNDAFDGYSIFRSVNSTSLFESIGDAQAGDASFVDIGALKVTGTYRYMIRKFRNDGEIIISTDQIVPLGSILLGNVVVSNGLSTATPTPYVIKDLLDPIRDEARLQLSVPTHIYYAKGDDRRIRVADELIITDWTTTDYQIYTTEQDIRGTNAFIAYINGVQSAFSSYVDTNAQTITFETAIFDITSTATAPVVSVIFTDVEEVTGILPETHIDNVLAVKVTKGKLSYEQMPAIDHFGRFKEPALPVPVSMTRSSPYIFIGDPILGVTFYDLIKTTDGRLLAATSDGIRLTQTDDSSSWTVVFSSTTPCSKLLYSSFYNWYFAIIGNGVYFSTDLAAWALIPGTGGANILRDITEDGAGKIYVSGDSGVYSTTQINTNQNTLYWQQTNTINTSDNSCYALLWYSGKLIASVSAGLYYTTNAGSNWLKLSGPELQVPIHSLIDDAGYYFALSENKVWRRAVNGNTFQMLASLRSPCRKLVIFNSDFYLTCDDGLLRSSPEANIYADLFVLMIEGFKQLERNGISPPVFGLRVIDTRLWMGLDELVYSATQQRNLMLQSDVGSVCPTIFVNQILRSVGVFYSQTGKVIFDEATDPLDDVSIVRSYQQFQLINGGWVDSQYDAPITLVINGVDQIMPATTTTVNGLVVTTPSKPTSVPNTVAAIAPSILQIVVPSFNARNSNFTDALNYLTLFVQAVDTINTDATFSPSTIATPVRVAAIYNYVNLLKANIDDDLQSQIVLPALGQTVTTASQITFSFDAVAGTLTIQSGVGKYSTVALSIQNAGLTGTGVTTHRDLEDTFELINSGLSTGLASVQQSNIIKTGIWNQFADPNGLENAGLSYQSRFRAACDDWYDKLNSTVDYTLQLDQSPTTIMVLGEAQIGSFSIEYPADILYVKTRGEVWVCGAGGIIAVDTTSFQCHKIVQSEFYYYNMHLDSGYVYTLAEDGLYQISTTDLTITKNLDFDILPNATSALQFGDTTYLAVPDGLYTRRPFEPSWRKVIDIRNAFVRSTDNLTFVAGTDPNDATVSVIYYSLQGLVWNRADQFTDYTISGASSRYDSVYYATNLGLLVEDVSTLFSNSSGPNANIQPIDLNGDGEPDNFVINSVDADTSTVIAAQSNGNWYQLAGNTVTSSGVSRLGTIHKVKVVDGKYWFFAGDLIDIQDQLRIIQLSTGKNLI